ncbi:2-phosphosulfolactate phosphatase [bacterium]|nr:2-phosphosulfolactate phosphatase [bacterium]
MKLKTLLLPDLLKASSGELESTRDPSLQIESHCELAIVIDVLRATSVMTAALHAGANKIITCRAVAEAELLAKGRSHSTLLCGERDCKRIPGFDLGNSPSDYSSDRVRQHDLILTTTNGTRAIDAVRGIPELAVASFLNLSSMVQVISQYSSVCLVCAGTDRSVTLEDVLLAGAIISQVRRNRLTTAVDDSSELAFQLWQSWFSFDFDINGHPSNSKLSERLRHTQGGRNLIQLGYEKDLSTCALIDAYPSVPMRVTKEPATFQSVLNE